MVAELAEPRGRQRHAPGCIELATRRDACEQNAVGIEDIDEAEPGAGDFVIAGRFFQRVRDEEIAVEVHDIERMEPRRNRRVGETPGDSRRSECGGEHIDLAIVKIGEIQQKLRATSGNRYALIGSTVRRGEHAAGRAIVAPPRSAGPGGRPGRRRRRRATGRS